MAGQRKVHWQQVALPGFQPWTYEKCPLYIAQVKLTQQGRTLDELTFRFGMREIGVKNRRYQLNGKSPWLRGSNPVFEWNWGDTITGHEVDYLVTEAREMSMNSFRTHTQPPPRLWCDVCNEHGTMILADSPVLHNYADYRFTPEEYAVWHRNVLADSAGWMARLWNHPSVIMRVLSNESRRDDAWEAGPFQDFVNALDPTRPTVRTGNTTKEHAMKKRITKNTRERQITRRELIGGALAAAGVITGAPAFLRGQNLNNKLNIAMIACGGRANANINGDGGNRRRERDAKAPSGPPTGIPAENITVLCDVNQNAVDAAAQRFPKAKKYNDIRRVFESPKDFDAVMVSTCEHTHTLATYLALTHGKHVYCEKPLTHDVWEARLIRETAAKYPKLATQTGNQGHASPVRRQIKELIMAGAIGPVREVHVWAGRAWGLQSAASAEKYDKPHGFYNGIQITERFKEEMPVPPNIHWDLWIGPAPMRPFHATYLPGPRWYRWWDFGNGTMSDLGGHDNDVAFQVLDLTQPLSVEAVSPMGKAHPELAPASMTVTYEFPARGSAPPVKLVWYQGEGRPPQFDASKMSERAQLFIGDKGMLYTGGRGGPQLLPEEKFKDYPTPPETLPRSPGHYIEWIRACKGEGPAPGANFLYSGWVTESNHLGNVAYRTGKKLDWDYVNLRARNAPEADQFIRRPYRKGWEGILS